MKIFPIELARKNKIIHDEDDKIIESVNSCIKIESNKKYTTNNIKCIFEISTVTADRIKQRYLAEGYDIIYKAVISPNGYSYIDFTISW